MAHLKRCTQIPFSLLLTGSVRVAQLAPLRLMRSNLKILIFYLNIK